MGCGNVKVDLRMCRGPDWHYDSQDGGPGNKGTVLGFKTLAGVVGGDSSNIGSRIRKKGRVIEDTSKGAHHPGYRIAVTFRQKRDSYPGDPPTEKLTLAEYVAMATQDERKQELSRTQQHRW